MAAAGVINGGCGRPLLAQAVVQVQQAEAQDPLPALKNPGPGAISAPPSPTDPIVPETKPAAETETTGNTPEEVGGPQGPEPTRLGDWEKAGRCSDF